MLKNLVITLLVISTLTIAQDFSGIRIYINPGHGGHDSDDRFIPETGFWESEGNLTKGLYLRDILLSLNANIKMSRTTNNSSDDLGLSVISADANNFDADFFHSIHSNALNGESNYTVLLYKEVNGVPAFPNAKTMCDIMANTIYQAHRTTTKFTRGDESFLGFNLGVLRNLVMPGTLSEGSFHDYIPESWRLRNSAYLKHEAWAITKAFIDYFNLETLPYGEIAGILRDPFDIVNYYFIPSTNDGKKPLNLSKATLLPDNKLYLGDALNNGFFMFDKITPGIYDVILEAENYEPDTVFAVTVNANKTTFVDRYLTPQPNFDPPVIVDYFPKSLIDVSLDTDVILEFNVKMDRVSVEQSFSISPNIIGTFAWEANDKKMIFTPSDFLQGGTIYNISLNTFAKSAFGVFLEEKFTSSFQTRSALKLVKSYPQSNSVNISTTVKVKLNFDAPIDEFSLGGNVFFQDSEAKDIPLQTFDEVDYENGWIIFESRDPLNNNAEYKIVLKKGIKDVEGANLAVDTTITFFTEPIIDIEGLSFIDFESAENWWQPSESGSTTGVNLSNTSFATSDKKKTEGANSGLLHYEFNSDSNGLCRLYNSEEPLISNPQVGEFGMWVFGDYSNNILEFWFRNNSGTNIPVFVDTLNWTGWKFKTVDLNFYTELQAFHSIVIKQNSLGEKRGQLYFDAAIKDANVTGVTNPALPNKFMLYQNYPNPFNPSTTISYSVSSSSVTSNPLAGERSLITNISSSSRYEALSVTLKVYDILGREIATLVNTRQLSGTYEVSFDASNLPSGIYYYQIKAGEFFDTKKMLLLK